MALRGSRAAVARGAGPHRQRRAPGRSLARSAAVTPSEGLSGAGIVDPVTRKLRPATQAEVDELEQRRADLGYTYRQAGKGGGGPGRAEGERFYSELKSSLLKGSAVQTGLLASYLFLTGQRDASASAVLGGAGALAYLGVLFRYVDGLKPEDVRAPEYDGNVQNLLALALGNVFKTYAQALNPRLLVPVAVAALAWGWNTARPFDKPDFELGFVLLGFLTYKGSVLGWTYENEIKPLIVEAVVGIEEAGEDDRSRPKPRPVVLSPEAFDEYVLLQREAKERAEAEAQREAGEGS